MQNRDRTRRKRERGRSDNAGSWWWTKKVYGAEKIAKNANGIVKNSAKSAMKV